MRAYINCNRCDFHTGSVIDGKYTVERPLGEGTFGKVFRVKRISDNKFFALKLLKLWAVESVERERLLKRFDQEYQTGLIESDYLVQSHGKGSVEGNPYILMEYCPGGDLLHGVETGKIDLAKGCIRNFIRFECPSYKWEGTSRFETRKCSCQSKWHSCIN